MASKIIVDQLEKTGGALTALTLPVANATANQYIKNDGAGALSWATLPGGGKVLQALQPAAVTSNTLSTTSTAFVDIAGLTVAITPSAVTSKILVLFNVMMGTTGGWHGHVRIVRDSTAIGVGDLYGSRKQSTSEASGGPISMGKPVPGIFLDSPSTTSATTYKLQWATESAGTIYLNRASTNTDNLNFGTFISTITVMEIGV
tara:strand:+ start:88 stop:696 length:609 start_codon:yes stop_codon:yes gene_type:complete